MILIIIKQQAMIRLTLIRLDAPHNKELVYTCDEKIFVERLKNENKDKVISKFRNLCMYANERLLKDRFPKIRKVFPSVEYTRTNSDGRHFFKKYNGVVMVKVDRLKSEKDVKLVKKIAAQRRCTWMAFKGCDGRSVVILLRYAYPDGDLPKDEITAEKYHEHIYMDACLLYQEILPVPVAVETSSIYQYCYMSVDEEPYYNPDAEIIPFLQPMDKPDYLFFKQAMLKYRKCDDVEDLSSDESLDMLLRYEMALRSAIANFYQLRNNDDTTNDLTPLFIQIAKTCRLCGIPEEEAVNRTWFHYEDECTKPAIRTLFYNVYQSSQKVVPQSVIKPSQQVQFQLDEFMGRRYVFRRNVLNGRFEYRERLSTSPRFEEITENVVRYITQEALREGLSIWDRDVRRYVYSEDIPRYNPVESYLFRNGSHTWDGKDYIRAFAKRVPTNDPLWPDKFYRFMIGMVAQWIRPENVHAHVSTILLTGPQGIHKSTFFKLLLPEELRFGYKDHLDFKNEKDALLSMSRYLLINVDEFDRITKRQQALLKFILQEARVNIRMINDRDDSSLPRMASMVGTSNTKQLLTDPTGSRRFICVDVNGIIDVEAPINYSQLYAQALDAVLRGERTYFTAEEERQLQADNKRFYLQDPLEQLFFEFFAIPDKEEEGEWLGVGEVLKELSDKTHQSLVTSSNINRLGQILRQSGLVFQHKKNGNKYQIIRIG